MDVVNIDLDGAWIEIPSEKGWATSQDADRLRELKKKGLKDEIKKSRIFLKSKAYDATIKIVSRDAKAKEFRIRIDPENGHSPIALSN